MSSLNARLTIDADWNDGDLRRRLATLGAEAVSRIRCGLLRANVYRQPRRKTKPKITVYPAVERRDGHVRFDQGTRVSSRAFTASRLIRVRTPIFAAPNSISSSVVAEGRVCLRR